ncbi:hypothetical protein DRQ50_15075 [bacterium]|nr:MAG: hypothetical protein DRQ50_15075 [bacterium]
MSRLIQTIALSAALVVLTVSLWQDWGLVTTVKRLVVSYLGFFFLGALAALAVRAGSLYEAPTEAGDGVRKRNGG